MPCFVKVRPFFPYLIGQRDTHRFAYRCGVRRNMPCIGLAIRKKKEQSKVERKKNESMISVVEPAAKHCTWVPIDLQVWQLCHTKNVQFFQCGCHDMSVYVKLNVSAKATSDTCCWHKVNYRLQAAWTELMTWQVFLFKQFSSAC